MSNPLKLVAPDVYCVDGEVKIPGAKLPNRMTVVRLADQSLLIHSPIAMDEATREAITALGTVKWIVAPTLMHHLFVQDAMKAFSSAKLLAVEGITNKRKDLTVDGVLSSDTQDFSNELLVQPVHGMPSLNECVFFHQPSKTLIVSDLLFNVVESPYFGTRMLLTLASGVYGRCTVSRLLKWAVKDKLATMQSLKRVIDWAPERIIMAHGDVLTTDASVTLERELQKLW